MLGSVRLTVSARIPRSPPYRPLHRLTVDTYAVQHPGEDAPQARNSVGIHLSRLSLMLERGRPIERANDATLAISAKKMPYPWLAPPANRGLVTVKHVLAARNPGQHATAVDQWARAVWQAWAEHQPIVRQWLSQLE